MEQRGNLKAFKFNIMAKRKIFSTSQLFQTDAPPAIKEMIGSVYGWLTIKRFGGYIIQENGTYGTSYVVCECKCGKEVLAGYYHVKKGNWLSCGCMKIERHPRLKHGATRDKPKIYTTWKGIRKRCYCTTDDSYCRYGGKGIVMCLGWHNSIDGFINFRKDMGEPPSYEHSIDRIDSTGNYSCGKCPECEKNGWTMNCRWADKYTQARNKSNNRYIVVYGEKMTFAEAERKLGLSHGAIKSRIGMGWSMDKIIKTPTMYSQRTRANLARHIVGWNFKEHIEQSDIDEFIKLWSKINPIPVYKSKRELNLLKHLNLL